MAITVAASADGKGLDTGLTGGAGEILNVKTDMEVYRVTEAGISLQATIAGTKFSKHEDLNAE